MSYNIMLESGEPYVCGTFASAIFSLAMRYKEVTANLVSRVTKKPVHICLAHLETLSSFGYLMSDDRKSPPEDRIYRATGYVFF